MEEELDMWRILLPPSFNKFADSIKGMDTTWCTISLSILCFSWSTSQTYFPFQWQTGTLYIRSVDFHSALAIWNPQSPKTTITNTMIVERFLRKTVTLLVAFVSLNLSFNSIRLTHISLQIVLLPLTILAGTNHQPLQVYPVLGPLRGAMCMIYPFPLVPESWSPPRDVGRTLFEGEYIDNANMTDKSCISYCSSKNLNYAGTEYASECCMSSSNRSMPWY